MKKARRLLPLALAILFIGCSREIIPETAVQAETRPQTSEPTERQPASMPTTTAVQTAEPAPTMTSLPTVTAVAATLPVVGPAPEWQNQVWINSDTPLPLDDLRGKVVLLEFWTFG